MTTTQQQATNEATTAETTKTANTPQVASQYQLNQFFANLANLKKNMIRVANIQVNPQSNGAFIGSPQDFWNAFARSQSTDILVAYRTFGQINPDIAQQIKDITDPAAITDIRVGFSIGNQLVTASYTLLNVKEAFDKHYSQSEAQQPDTSNDSKVLEKAG